MAKLIIALKSPNSLTHLQEGVVFINKTEIKSNRYFVYLPALQRQTNKVISRISLAKVDESTDCICAFSQDLEVVIWNGATEKKYSLLRSDAIGKNLLDLFPHIHEDFRIKCFREAIDKHKTFFFSMLPYLYTKGDYTQLIVPAKEHPEFRVLSIVRDHIGSEKYKREDLLRPLLLG